jgi:hypothetical protein
LSCWKRLIRRKAKVVSKINEHVKIYISVFLICMLSAPVLAQSRPLADSVAREQQEEQKISLAMKSIGLLERIGSKTYGIAELALRQEKGDYRRAQEPYARQSVRFYSEGFRKIGRFSLSGRFLFDRQTEDSLANTLDGVFNELKPFYYFAGKHGEYERQLYDLSAMASYALTPGKWFVGLGVDYRKQASYGSVDPRTEVNAFRMLLKPEISFRTREHQFSAGAVWGYGNEETGVAYKSDDFKYSLQYPDRIHYTNQGYGFIVMRDTASLRRFDHHAGWTLSYQTQRNDWTVQARVQHLVSNTDNTHDTKHRTAYFTRSSYRQEDISAAVLISEEKDKRRQQFELSVLSQSGQDLNSVFRAHNYSATNRNYFLSYRYQRTKSERWQPELGASLRYRYLMKEDLAADHYLLAESLQPGILLASSHRFRNSDRLRISLSPSVRIPLSTEVEVPPTQENVFTQTVAYPDFYYFSAEVLELNAGAEYVSHHVLRQVPLGIFADMNYLNQNNRDQSVYNASRIPSGSRYVFNFGIRIYL